MNHHGFGTIDEDIIGPLLKLVDGVLKHAEVEFGSSTLTDSNDGVVDIFPVVAMSFLASLAGCCRSRAGEWRCWSDNEPPDWVHSET